MATILSQYYADELAEWAEAIEFYRNEILILEQKLEEVVSRNTIPDIGEKTELHQNLLDHITDAFYRLDLAIQDQEGKIKTDHSLTEDKLILKETEDHQNEIRRNMKEVEKAFIDAKYQCLDFISGTFKK